MPSESETLSRQSATSQAWVKVSGSPSSAEDLSPPGSGSGFSGEEMMSASRSGSQVGIAKAGPVSREPKSGPSRGNQRSNVPVPRPEQRDSGSHQTPPAQPPSLTLSLFTMPSHLSFFRVVAVMGINLVLPFVNGVMLGFGEIFAREVVKVGKIWWKEGGSLLRSTERRSSSEAHDMDRSFAGGRGIAGVGLSGSGGFP